MNKHRRPQHGDIAYYVSCVSGGDPYQVTVVYRYSKGWFNVTGAFVQPVDVTGRTLHLVKRQGEKW